MFKLSAIIFFLVFFHLTAAAQDYGSLKGKVTDEFDKPLRGATVRLEPDGHSTETDAKGNFSFNKIFTGNYNITVSMVGKINHQANIKIGSAATNNLIIKLSDDERELNDIAVSENRAAPDNLLKLERSAMPVTVISRCTIELMGSRRLDEILKEQTGIAIVNNIGGGARSVGVQIQGFSSEYIMILIDGQPMVGRNSGNFDLSRISVSNIERIEIIKGASSCLFGSEALGRSD